MGIQNEVDFSLKVTRFKENFHILLNEGISGQGLKNEYFFIFEN